VLFPNADDRKDKVMTNPQDLAFDDDYLEELLVAGTAITLDTWPVAVVIPVGRTARASLAASPLGATTIRVYPPATQK
jgi:hypothetical protein